MEVLTDWIAKIKTAGLLPGVEKGAIWGTG
jgi:hypothetical protein